MRTLCAGNGDTGVISKVLSSRDISQEFFFFLGGDFIHKKLFITTYGHTNQYTEYKKLWVHL